MKEHRITLGREDTLVIETDEGFIEICRDARPRMKHHLIITTPDDSALVKSKETDFTERISGMRRLRYHEVKDNRVCLKNLSRHTVFRIKGITDGTGKRVRRDPIMASVADR